MKWWISDLKDKVIAEAEDDQDFSLMEELLLHNFDSVIIKYERNKEDNVFRMTIVHGGPNDL